MANWISGAPFNFNLNSYCYPTGDLLSILGAKADDGPGRADAEKLLEPEARGHFHAQAPARTEPHALETSVERFDRRGIEPFELFTWEFGQNYVKFQRILLEKINYSTLKRFRKY